VEKCLLLENCYFFVSFPWGGRHGMSGWLWDFLDGGRPGGIGSGTGVSSRGGGILVEWWWFLVVVSHFVVGSGAWWQILAVIVVLAFWADRLLLLLCRHGGH